MNANISIAVEIFVQPGELKKTKLGADNELYHRSAFAAALWSGHLPFRQEDGMEQAC